jgi:hypothetical protein
VVRIREDLVRVARVQIERVERDETGQLVDERVLELKIGTATPVIGSLIVTPVVFGLSVFQIDELIRVWSSLCAVASSPAASALRIVVNLLCAELLFGVRNFIRLSILAWRYSTDWDSVQAPTEFATTGTGLDLGTSGELVTS